MMRHKVRGLFRRPVTLLLLAGVMLVAGLAAWRQWPRQYLRRGEAALAAREYDQARALLNRYLSFRPGDALARLLAARAARRLREYHEAFDHLQRCRTEGGDLEVIEVETALIAVQRGAEPSPELRQRAEQEDDLALVILEVLIQYDIDTYRLGQALQELTRFLRARPNDLQALVARGYVWERFLCFLEAQEDYRKAVREYPDSLEARQKLAEVLLISGTPDEALEQFEWLATRMPERHEVKLGLARCRRRLGQYEEARQLLDTLWASAPEDGAVLWERGQLELDGGQPEEAERWLRKAVQARPHDRHAVYSLSRCLLALGQRDEADKLTARAAQIDADLKRLDQVRRAVMKQPDNAALRCEVGLIFLKNGEPQEGIRWLRMALRLDPNCQAAREALAGTEGRLPEQPQK
jgi:predicted Zn-dependent protease